MTPPLPASDDFVEYEASPERRLMLAVLLTAIVDASGGNTGATQRNSDQARRVALGWIRDGGADFQEVCELAGFDPRHVRQSALKFINSDQPAPRMHRVSLGSGDHRHKARQVHAHA